MHQIHFDYHPIAYLSSSFAWNENTGEEIVALTVRSERESFRPYNLGITRSEGERLLKDLQRLLVAAPLLLMLLLGTGCSARVDVATESSNGAESSAVRTTVEVDVLSEGNSAPDSSPAQEESVVVEEGEIAESPNFATIVYNNVEIHRHRHEHLHIEIDHEPRRKRTNPERDPECERLRREHEIRMSEWRELFAK